MSRNRSTLSLLLAGFGVGLTMLACNLSGSNRPPTIVPRATPTPQPTIGYATLSPEELPAQVTPLPSGDADLFNLINQVDADRLFIHIQTLVSFGTRHVNSPYNLPNQGIGAARFYIMTQLQKISDDSGGRLVVFESPFNVTWADIQSQPSNIIGLIQGTEPGAGTLLIGAHYDSTSIDWEDGAAYAPGANDNGSGVAALLELARIMSWREHRASVLFVFFSAEEVRRQGSIAFVREYIAGAQIDLTAMLNLDIIGSQTGPDGSVNDRQIRVFSEGPNESQSRQLARSLNRINYVAFNQTPYLDILVEDSADRAERYSDHISFSEAGYPAVRFIEALEEPNRQHNERDTMDDVQASYLTRATQTVLVVATSMADGLRAPRNISLRANSNGTQTLVWEPIQGAVSYVVALRFPGSFIYNTHFEITESSITWDRFVPTSFAGLAIATRDETGQIGPFSHECFISDLGCSPSQGGAIAIGP